MKAIVTKYLSPTATKGSRIKASDGDGNTVTVPVEYDCSLAEAHLGAAYALCAKMDWLGYLAQGSAGNGFAHVFVGDAMEMREALRDICRLLAEDAVELGKHGRAQSKFAVEARRIAVNSKEGL